MEPLISKKYSHEFKGDFLQGVIAGIPIMIGYIPIAIAFGMISTQSGISLSESFLMSVLVFAGASQFMAVNMFIGGASGIEIIAATFVLNLRHFVMSMSLMHNLNISKRWKTGLSFGITDETFAVASLKVVGTKNDELNHSFMTGLIGIAYGSWIFGTALGGLLTNIIPTNIGASMSVALYAMFIGLLIPAIRDSWKVGIIALSSILLSILFSYIVDSGWAIVLATIFGSLIGVFFSEEEL